ncbi:hypothetical protein Tco_0987132, partial [Tanacetum coccineum]
MGFKPKQVFQPVSKKSTTNTVEKKKYNSESTNEVSKSNPFEVLTSVDNNVIWVLMGVGSQTRKLRFLDDDGNPLVPTGIIESDGEVEVVFDETANLRISMSGKDESDKGYVASLPFLCLVRPESLWDRKCLTNPRSDLMVVQRSQEEFEAMSLNQDNFLDWENKLRTWLSICGELEFIDRTFFLILRCGLEIIKSLEMMDLLERQHHMLSLIDMWSMINMEKFGKIHHDDDLTSAHMTHYVDIIEMFSSYGLCMKVMHLDVKFLSKRMEDLNMTIRHEFMDKLHGLISESEMNQTSSTVNVLCKDCGKGKMHKLHERGILMNKVKFETYEAMDARQVLVNWQ